MVFSLAPNSSSSGSFQIRHTAVSTKDSTTCRAKQLPMMRSAPSRFRLPSSMDASGAPPIATRAAKAEIIIKMGAHTPTPVSARPPTSFMCPR